MPCFIQSAKFFFPANLLRDTPVQNAVQILERRRGDTLVKHEFLHTLCGRLKQFVNFNIRTI